MSSSSSLKGGQLPESRNSCIFRFFDALPLRQVWLSLQIQVSKKCRRFLTVFPSTWIWFQESTPAGIQVSDITRLLSPCPPVPGRSSFKLVIPTLINCLSLRCLWILLSNPAWELGITVQAGNLCSSNPGPHRANVSTSHRCTHPWRSVSRSGVEGSGNLVSKACTPPLPAYTLGLGPSENKAGSIAFKEFLFPAVHNLETRTHKGQGNILGISWGWRTQIKLFCRSPNRYSTIINAMCALITNEMVPPRFVTRGSIMIRIIDPF